MSGSTTAADDEVTTHGSLETVGQLERKRVRALIESDVLALASLFADELVYNHSSGGRDTKVSLLEKIASGVLSYLDIDDPEPQVTLAGSTAVVTGRMVGRVRVGGELRNVNSRTMSVWIFRDGRWQFFAFQPSVPRVTSNPPDVADNSEARGN